MPQTCATSSPALGIRLEGDQTDYAPGDTIIGCVYRKMHAVSPKSSVGISLHGRSKSKIDEQHGQHHTTYRGRFSLIPEGRYAQKLFEGPLHVAGYVEQAWPFAITLPTHVDPGHLNGGTQDESCIPLDATDHVLPSTYAWNSSGTTQGFVEYYLKAGLRMNCQNNVEVVEATLPFRVTSLNPDPPIADFQPQSSRNASSVSSYRLIPGLEDANLSWSQKMKQSFRTPSVPAFWFNLEVELPSIVQLDNPTPIPFRLRAMPDWPRTTAILQNVPQQMKLTWISLHVAATTKIICAGTRHPHSKDKETELDLYIQDAMRARGKAIYIPCNGEAPVDVGELIGIRIGRQGNASSRRPSNGQGLTPSFTTYNIRHTHRLNWVLRAEVVGETFELTGTRLITLLMPSDEHGHPNVPGPSRPPLEGRSESWIQPPGESDAPPSFAQVEKEESKAQNEAVERHVESSHS
ncbi:hypothetical protein FZEAL_8529 [Fusarium zealandicum]|uniref:Arrestin-like N-terminal domain-containing protein n=1 Tax=Fusarium zealandicum TaxID=1053134 RepID=A0A8H4XHK6_9HYPO|nr:hypothetical protein FZEAL_8529 [Fusarium zealandicum]